MHTQDLIIEQRQGVAHLILNRPQALNALNLSMVRQMHQALKRWASDEQVKVVVVRGAGEKAFCAGGDIRTLYEGIQAQSDAHMDFFKEEFALNEYIYSYPKPYIAIMDGYVMGGGMGISQGASHRVVTERTKLSMPETAIGYFPDVGGSFFLSRCPGSLGLYLGVTGQTIMAADAVYARLADTLLPTASLSAFYARLEQLEGSPHSQAMHEQIQAILQELNADDQALSAGFQSTAQAIEACFSRPTLDDILAAVRERAAQGDAGWAQEALKKLHKNSPLAMTATLALIKRGASLNLSECFALELKLVAQWMQAGDFLEGVRALIVDKDNLPRWRFDLAELTPKRLQATLPALFAQH